MIASEAPRRERGQRKPVKNYEFKGQGIILDGSNGSLRKGNGDVVELRPQSREVLRVLAESPNQTISKSEFSEAV